MIEKDDPQAIKKRTEIYRTMSPARKWEEFKRLRATAWELKKAALREKFPQLSDEELDQKVKKIFLYAST